MHRAVPFRSEGRFNLGEVSLPVPSPDERADNPPAGFYTLYEVFFYGCFLWLPIPRLVLEYVTSYQFALSQITMRSLRHLLGIFIRSYESETDITLAHLKNLLEIRRVPKSEVDWYYISPVGRLLMGSRARSSRIPFTSSLWPSKMLFMTTSPGRS